MVKGSGKSKKEPLASSAIGLFWQIIESVCVSISNLWSENNDPCCLSPILHSFSDCKLLLERNYYLQHVCIVAKTTGSGFVLGLLDNTVAGYNKINS